MNPPAPDPAPTEERRLLVVSDDSAEGQLLRASLEPRGYAVVTTPPGEGVWLALEGFKPDLIALDLAPDLIDPQEELARIAAARPEGTFTPLLAIFPDKVPGPIKRAFERGADDFIVRPFELIELLQRLEVVWRMKALQDTVLASNVRLHGLAVTDALTGLCNQREFKRRLALELQRVKRFGIPVAVIFFDCDRFKAVNDAHGHAMGSHVLREIARLLVATLRETDILGRYGGDEFVVALPGCDLLRGLEVAERVRELVGMTRFRLDAAERQVTLSLGVAVCTSDALMELEPLLNLADQALYEAKNTGRNRTCVSAGAPATAP